jgi:hypothetical protein
LQLLDFGGRLPISYGSDFGGIDCDTAGGQDVS